LIPDSQSARSGRQHMADPHRLENLVSWFAASVLVTAGVIYGLRLRDHGARPSRPPAPPRATPAQEPLRWQERRAGEAGRGRGARGPLEIPWAGWKDILVRTYREIQEDRLLALAAGVAFYSLIALFPGIAAGVSSYALFANTATISNHLQVAADIVPANALDIMGTEITRIAAKSDGRLTFGFLLGLAIALWSANAGMKAIFDALNIIYDEEEKRGIVRLNLVSLFFTICAIVCAGPRCSCCSFSGFPCSIATDRAGGLRNGGGSASAASPPLSSGSRSPRCSPGTSAISPITTPPTVRSARW
jgi:membrane protein